MVFLAQELARGVINALTENVRVGNLEIIILQSVIKDPSMHVNKIHHYVFSSKLAFQTLFISIHFIYYIYQVKTVSDTIIGKLLHKNFHITMYSRNRFTLTVSLHKN